MTVHTDANYTRLVCDLEYHSGTVQTPTQPVYISCACICLKVPYIVQAHTSSDIKHQVKASHSVVMPVTCTQPILASTAEIMAHISIRQTALGLISVAPPWLVNSLYTLVMTNGWAALMLSTTAPTVVA